MGITLLDTDLLKDPVLYSRYYQVMPEGRRRKIDTFRFDKDKRLSLGAGILLMRGLGEGSVVTVGEYGKPLIKGRNDLHFNLSHSGHVAACAFSDQAIGLDVEVNRHFKDLVIKRVFHSEELALAGPEGESDSFHTRLWTVKESLIKCLGRGMSLDPGRVRVLKIERDYSKGKGDEYPAVWQIMASVDHEDRSELELNYPDIFHIRSWELGNYQLSLCYEYQPDIIPVPRWLILE